MNISIISVELVSVQLSVPGVCLLLAHQARTAFDIHNSKHTQQMLFNHMFLV